MEAVSALLTIIVTYYAYQWGIGHKKQPHGVIVFIVMMLSLLTTVPAYYFGKHHRGVK